MQNKESKTVKRSTTIVAQQRKTSQVFFTQRMSQFYQKKIMVSQTVHPFIEASVVQCLHITVTVTVNLLNQPNYTVYVSKMFN